MVPLPSQSQSSSPLRMWRRAGLRLFVLDRLRDPTGTSGTGEVAEGIEFSDGTVALRWLSATPSTVLYQSVNDMLQVHGHGGSTVVRWLARQQSR
jgi:hypothetical protein